MGKYVSFLGQGGSWLDGFKAVGADYPIPGLEVTPQERACAIARLQEAEAAYVDANPTPPLPKPDDDPARYRAGAQALTAAFTDDVADHFWAAYYRSKIWVKSIDTCDQPAGTRMLAWGNSADYDAVRARINGYVYDQAVQLARDAGTVFSPEAEQTITEQRQSYQDAQAEADAQAAHEAELAAERERQAEQYRQEYAAEHPTDQVDTADYSQPDGGGAPDAGDAEAAPAGRPTPWLWYLLGAGAFLALRGRK